MCANLQYFQTYTKVPRQSQHTTYFMIWLIRFIDTIFTIKVHPSSSRRVEDQEEEGRDGKGSGLSRSEEGYT